MTNIPIKIQFLKTLSNLKPHRIIVVKGDSDATFRLYITDKSGMPFPIEDLSGETVTIQNTDGNIDVTGTTNITLNISQNLLNTINSALQSGDNISELTNDAGYITTFVETDPVFQASEASLFEDGDKAKLDTAIQPNDLGAVAFSNDYNDLDNKPTIPTVITNHSGLSLDDGTNPHGTTKDDVGLGNVDNTSDIDKPISTATQNVLDLKLDKVSTAGVERAYIINADGSQGTKATSDFKSYIIILI